MEVVLLCADKHLDISVHVLVPSARPWCPQLQHAPHEGLDDEARAGRLHGLKECPERRLRLVVELPAGEEAQALRREHGHGDTHPHTWPPPLLLLLLLT